MIRQLPDRRALAIRSKYAAAVPKLPMAWKDRLHKKARRRGRGVPPIHAGLARSEPAILTIPDHLPAPAGHDSDGAQDATILRGPWDPPGQPWRTP